MTRPDNFTGILCARAAACFICAGAPLHAQDSGDTRQQLQEMREQNQALQKQLLQQQSLIESLSRKVNEIQSAGVERQRDVERLQSQVEEPRESVKSATAGTLGKVSISGEGGVGFFNSGSEGQFPKGQFRVDEARLFVETPLLDEVYFFGELNLMTREASDLSLQLGECYLDFENVSRLWHRDGMLNLRIGRMDTPFGEEYLARYAIDNPLISHSLSDVWGVNAGLELYGRLGKFSYVAAVQNGGADVTRNYDADKSVSARLAFDPESWLHLSISGMRTGDLKAPEDSTSQLWFGNGWFVPFGSANTTRFHANLAEGDIQIRWRRGHVRAFGGYANYDDNDPAANNRRDIYYYSVEGVHELTRKLYAGVRYSQIFADKGYPITGNGDMGTYLFSGELTKEIWRLSLGLGYRFSQNLVLKAEYTFERGRELDGESRNHEDFFGLEAAYKF
jgi:hypothetical protein